MRAKLCTALGYLLGAVSALKSLKQFFYCGTIISLTSCGGGSADLEARVSLLERKVAGISDTANVRYLEREYTFSFLPKQTAAWWEEYKGGKLLGEKWGGPLGERFGGSSGGVLPQVFVREGNTIKTRFSAALLIRNPEDFARGNVSASCSCWVLCRLNGALQMGFHEYAQKVVFPKSWDCVLFSFIHHEGPITPAEEVPLLAVWYSRYWSRKLPTCIPFSFLCGKSPPQGDPTRWGDGYVLIVRFRPNRTERSDTIGRIPRKDR